MLSLRKPSSESITRFLAQQKCLDFTYSAVGATAQQLPDGYTVDRTRVKLGEGKLVFAAAITAMRRWEQFRLRWIEARPPHTAIEVGQVIAIVARACGVWWWNACRIVYVVDETDRTCSFGFAYGTLPSHAESGEERFLIEWDCVSDDVWYEILAFSRPRHPLARLGHRFARRAQQRFARESAEAMQRAVQSIMLHPK